VRIGPVGLALALTRGTALTLVTYGGLALLLGLRMVERPLLGPQRRPMSPHVTRSVCRAAFRVLGMRHTVTGIPMREKGALVANHVSWLDIFTLNACDNLYFVSKSEVARWPVIGWLARATGTVFIDRDPRAARRQQQIFEDRLRAGHRLLFFPEGTSTDGLRVLPFKSTLFAAFYPHGLELVWHIQPVCVIYRPPKGREARFYGWWGDMAFAPHLLKSLAVPRQGSVEVVFHDPVSVEDFASRKELAAHCEAVVRAAVAARLGPDLADGGQG